MLGVPLMRHRVLLCALALIVVASLSPIGAKPAEGNADWSSSSPADVPRPETRSASYDPRTVLVRFKKDSSSTARSAAIRQVGAVRSSRIAGSDFVKVPVRYAASAVRTLRENPAVGAATFNFRRELFAEPNDEKYTEQHYLDTVRMPEAWDQINDASGQVIAVVDTGVDASHPDLVDRVVAGHNVLDPTAPPDDYDPNTASAGGHGTAVAGLAAANTNNTYGMAGVTWSGRVMPIKAVHADGTALDSDLIAGIVWAADHGAAVINLSLGSPPDSPALHDAVK